MTEVTPSDAPHISSYSKDERTWAMLCHLSTFSCFVIPFGNIIGPLIVWLTKKEESALVDDQGKEALNFQISMTIYLVGAGILSIILIGLPILFGLLILDLIVTIMACIQANDGVEYRYPMTIRFIN